MVIKTKALVISKLKYKDNDLIVKCFTMSSGIKSYLVKNAFRSRRGKFSVAYFQLLSLIEIEADHQPNRSLNYIKDIRVHLPYESLHTNIIKSTVVLFLAEVLSMILIEEEPNTALFQYIETALLWFDTKEKDTTFHHKFLFGITKFMGVAPELSTIEMPYFNLEEGRFQTYRSNPYCITGEKLILLKSLLGTKFDSNAMQTLASEKKQMLLDMILTYFRLHLQGFRVPKSLTILNQVFN
jgi:DNA repair protein RecO (recombination protein O)